MLSQVLQIEKLANYLQIFILYLDRVLMNRNCHLLIHICEEGTTFPFGDFSHTVVLKTYSVWRNKILADHLPITHQSSLCPPDHYLLNQASCLGL